MIKDLVLFYDKHGNKINRKEYYKKFGDRNYRRIAIDSLANGVSISTVWLGIDHGYGNKLLIFETMVFSKNGDEQDVCRYSTEEEAIVGHKKMVEKFSKIINRKRVRK